MVKRSRFRAEYFVLGTASIILLIIVILPLFQLFVRSFQHDGGFSFNNYKRILEAKQNYVALVNTLKVGTATALFSVLIGAPLAWLVSRTDIPYAKILRTLFMIPYMIPPFVGAIAWSQLLNRRNGYVNVFLRNSLGLNNAVFNINTIGGLIWVMSLYLFPFVFITTVGALERMDPTLEEAARCAGAKPFRVMKDITIPLVAPSIAGGALLAFASSIANFGIPAFIGMQGRVYVLTTMIYSYMHTGGFGGIRMATALSVALMLISVSALLINNFYLQKKQYSLIVGKSMRPKVVELRKWRVLFFLLSILVVTITVIAPFASVFFTSLLKAWGAEFKLGNLTLRNYYYILFEHTLTKTAIRNSFLLATSSATIAMVLGSLIAYINVKTNIKGRKLLETISLIPYTIPGTVVAIAMILAWSGTYGVNLYNSFWILILAYVAHYIAFSVRTTSSSLEQIHISLEEAARASGGTWLHSLRDIVIPLIKPGLISGWFLIFMPTLRELTMSVLLWGPRTMTIGVAVFEMQEAGYFHISAAMACVLLFTVLAGNWIIKISSGGNLGI